jgi:tRNA(Leu) C34 or U34 (ribose-2'-O)-methylase TrmL
MKPAIVLMDPKYPHNVGAVLRAASCYGAGEVCFNGSRVADKIKEVGRIPREERMKGYKDVALLHRCAPLDHYPNHIPVAVELRENAENLFDFEHPENPVYVFGPEDGSLGRSVLSRCHRFLVIPTRFCLNLSAAVYTILYDRAYKIHQKTGVFPTDQFHSHLHETDSFELFVDAIKKEMQK